MAIETEFQILNTLLFDKAAQLQLTEYRIFDLFCAWEGIDSAKTGYEVKYPTRFELRDKKADLDFVKAAREVSMLIKSVSLQHEMNKQFARVALADDDLIERVDKELDKIKLEVPVPRGGKSWLLRLGKGVEVVSDRYGGRMVGTKCFFVNCQRTAVERLGCRIVALRIQQ